MLGKFLLENSSVLWFSINSLNILRKVCGTTGFNKCLLTSCHGPGTLLNMKDATMADGRCHVSWHLIMTIMLLGINNQADHLWSEINPLFSQ